MSPRPNQHFEMISGDTATITVTVDDGAGGVVDLTGATVTFAMSKDKPGSRFNATAKITKTVGDGVTLTDPTNGVMTVALDAADTDDLSGRYHYEIEVTDTSSNVATVTTGIITIKPDLVTP